MFDERELKYLQNQDFLKTKVVIQEKMQTLLGQVQSSLRHHLTSLPDFSFPPNTDLIAGKISRGDRYQGLPYWVLDYPKLMAKHEIFTLRTMVWWGNEFSCTLHIGGKIWEDMQKNMLKKEIDTLQDSSVYFCVNENPWIYAFSAENYLPITEINHSRLTKMLSERDFIKLSRRLSLKYFEQLPEFACESLKIYLSMIQ